MDKQVIEWVFTFLMAVLAYFGKSKIDQIEKRLDNLEADSDEIKETYYKKEDFKEFRSELWLRLDRLDQRIDRVLKDRGP